jgi:hypothetical protein
MEQKIEKSEVKRESYAKELKIEVIELIKTRTPTEVHPKLGIKYATLLKCANCFK